MKMPIKPKGASSRHFVHGLSHTQIDNVYKSMISRCYKPTNNRYYRYGGRGIRVCDEWKNNKASFFQWAFENGYEQGLTLDRIDCDKNYSPDNCRWATQQVQQNNRSNNHLITVDNETHTVTEWSRIINVNASTVYFHSRKNDAVEYIRNKLCTQ